MSVFNFATLIVDCFFDATFTVTFNRYVSRCNPLFGAFFQANIDRALAKNPILVTALNPVIGYEKAAKIAKQAYKEARPIIDVAEQETDLPREELEKLLNPTKLTQGGL